MAELIGELISKIVPNYSDTAWALIILTGVCQVYLTGSTIRSPWQASLSGLSDRLGYQASLTGIAVRSLWQASRLGAVCQPSSLTGLSDRLFAVRYSIPTVFAARSLWQALRLGTVSLSGFTDRFLWQTYRLCTIPLCGFADRSLWHSSRLIKCNIYFRLRWKVSLTGFAKKYNISFRLH